MNDDISVRSIVFDILVRYLLHVGDRDDYGRLYIHDGAFSDLLFDYCPGSEHEIEVAVDCFLDKVLKIYTEVTHDP